MKNQDELVEELLLYAKIHLHREELDLIDLRNRLRDVFGDGASWKKVDIARIAAMKNPDELIQKMQERGIIDANAIVGILGMLTPPPSEVARKAREREERKSGSGLEYLYDLSVKNDYIRSGVLAKNRFFSTMIHGKELEIAINLSKPEKSNQEIVRALKKRRNVYPKCPLCVENIGYSGDERKASRANLRVFPIRFGKEEWFVQYSPYAYFSHHLIVVSKTHRKMVVNVGTFRNLLAFTDRFPDYFIGSNADLPIVGGSILEHRHYQGGTHRLPIFTAKDRKIYFCNDGVKVSSLEWDCTVLKVQGKKKPVLRFAKAILSVWKTYDDESVGLFSHTGKDRHNGLAPIARKEKDGYALYLILKNNRCDETYPEGIFHAHREHHLIKSEGIGLVESAGLFILPPRVREIMRILKEILSDGKKKADGFSAYPSLRIYEKRIEEGFRENACDDEENIENQVQTLIGETCAEILKNTAVFKNDRAGKRALDRLMEKVLRES